MKTFEHFFNIVPVLLGMGLSFAACAQEEDVPVPEITTLKGTDWVFTENETKDGFEYEYTTQLSFDENELTLFQVLKQDGEIGSLADGTFDYTFDGRTVRFQVMYERAIQAQPVELELSDHGSQLTWIENEVEVAVFERK